MAKTILDRTAAFAGLFVLSPLLAIIWLTLATYRDGPPVFRQERVGRHKKPFMLYKFRTLPVETAHLPTHMLDQTGAHAVARFVRRTKLDELPQLFNVLRGDMSLVGPRPCLTTQHDLIRERELLGVFTLRPGITGYAQIRGIDMSDPEVLAKADGYYASTRSFAGDVAIVLATVGIGCWKGDHAV